MGRRYVWLIPHWAPVEFFNNLFSYDPKLDALPLLVTDIKYASIHILAYHALRSRGIDERAARQYLPPYFFKHTAFFQSVFPRNYNQHDHHHQQQQQQHRRQHAAARTEYDEKQMKRGDPKRGGGSPSRPLPSQPHQLSREEDAEEEAYWSDQFQHYQQQQQEQRHHQQQQQRRKQRRRRSSTVETASTLLRLEVATTAAETRASWSPRSIWSRRQQQPQQQQPQQQQKPPSPLQSHIISTLYDTSGVFSKMGSSADKPLSVVPGLPLDLWWRVSGGVGVGVGVGSSMGDGDAPTTTTILQLRLEAADGTWSRRRRLVVVVPDAGGMTGDADHHRVPTSATTATTANTATTAATTSGTTTSTTTTTTTATDWIALRVPLPLVEMRKGSAWVLRLRLSSSPSSSSATATATSSFSSNECAVHLVAK